MTHAFPTLRSSDLHREHRDPPEPAQYDTSVSACFGSANGLHREILVRIAPEYRCFALGITIDELICMAAREDREENALLHHVDDPVIISGRAHPTVLDAFLEGHGDPRPVGDGALKSVVQGKRMYVHENVCSRH